MRFKNFLTFLGLFSAFLLLHKPVQATHLYGGEMAYEYLGQLGTAPNQYRYRITMKHYVTCVGNSISPTASFNYYNFNGTNSGTFIKSQMQTSTVSPPLPITVPGSCPVALPCMQIRTFVQQIDLPLSFNGYYVAVAVSARNTDIDNIQGGNMSLYMQIPPPVLTNPGSSPVFTDTAVVVMFAGDTASVINSAFDADGDRLNYSFSVPYAFSTSSGPFATPPQAVTYNPGFSINQPFGAGGYAAIDPNTGLAKYFVPTIPGSMADRKFVVSIQVKEFRNINGVDVLIGSTMRDIQLIVKNPPLVANALPVISYTGPKTITVTEGQAITPISFTFTDSNPGQMLKVTATSPLLDGPGNRNAAFNALTTSPAQLTNVASGTTATFSFTATCGDLNSFPLNITVTDNACPPGQRIESFQIQVIPAPRVAAPTNIILPVSAINENVPANTVVAQFQVTDPDLCDTHALSLVAGTGSTDNGDFTISPTGFISINTVPDFETKPNYTIRVKAMDEGGLFYEKTLSISVNDIDEIAPTLLITSSAANPTAVNPIPVTITFTENVTGFTASDVVISGGTISNFTGSGLSYSFEIIPTASGLITVNIPAGVAMDAAGNGNTAAALFSITYNGPTGIHDNDAEFRFGLKVYPNPASGNFTVALQNTNKAGLTILDLTGRKVLSKELKSVNGNVNETLEIKESPGIYFLQINADGKQLTRKLILQN